MKTKVCHVCGDINPSRSDYFSVLSVKIQREDRNNEYRCQLCDMDYKLDVISKALEALKNDNKEEDKEIKDDKKM